MSEVCVLAMDVPGRYVVGTGSATPDKRGLLHLTEVAHVTLVGDDWTFQAVALLDTFSASVSSYAGFGMANETCLEQYLIWREYRRNPPIFEVEETE